MQPDGVNGFAAWRLLARERLAAAVRPDEVTWSDWKTPSLFGERAQELGRERARPKADCEESGGSGSGVPGIRPHIPRELLELLELLACYRDASRWDLMYRLTWRVVHENRALLQNHVDVDVQTARSWSRAVSQDIHKMHAFVRFHETLSEDGAPFYVAWFEPAHEILASAVPFFEKRFGNMKWMIATQDGAAVSNGVKTDFVDSPARSLLPRADSTHGLWRAYYRNVCNVARVNPRAMQREMPRRYWRHLPEASEIQGILQSQPQVLHETLHSAAVIAPTDQRVPRAVARTLDRAAMGADSLETCRRCSLWQRATQAVPGRGPTEARMMLVGEQPGDEEDVRGAPFVGPAGHILDEALQKAGLERAELYLTNAVKHFKWEPRGKRRLHVKPNQSEVLACSGWLEREISEVSPRVIVALGATAIRAACGLSLTVEGARRSALRSISGRLVVATYHPSAILRAPDGRRGQLREMLIEDLMRAAREATVQD